MFSDKTVSNKISDILRNRSRNRFQITQPFPLKEKDDVFRKSCGSCLYIKVMIKSENEKFLLILHC